VSKGPNISKGKCRVCHHRADLHYDGYCHKKQGEGVCGCVGLDAGALGDTKKGGKRGSRYLEERHGLKGGTDDRDPA
jgi:hypothetical protein